MNTHAPPPAQMFQMITGYWVTQLISSVAQLGVIDALAEGPQTADEVATRVGANPGAMARVLRAATTSGMVTRDGEGRFAATPVGETLRKDVPGSMRDFAIAQAGPGHWLPWGRLSTAVKTGETQARAALGCEIFDHYAANPEEAAAFTGAMQGLSSMVAAEAARLVDTQGVTRAIDVGGAGGTLITALLNANPGLSGIVLDLPHVVGTTRAKLGAAGLAERCEAVGGDFFAQVPSGDLYLLKQILHDWDDAQCKQILANIAKAMTPGARVVVVEMVIPEDGTPSPAPLMDLNMLAVTGGCERTASEYAALFATAGLKLDGVVATRSPFQLVLASRA